MFSRKRRAWIVTTAAFLAASAAGAAQATAQAATGATGTRVAGQAFTQVGAGKTVRSVDNERTPRDTRWPRQVYAPYYETWLSGTLPATAAQSGSPYLTLAFIQAPSAGSCRLAWNGDSTQPIPGPAFAAQITGLQRAGGDVIPSFGGYSADEGGTEIADSCTDVATIAADYESVISSYHVTRLDMDVEANSLSNPAGISRRNQAVKMTEAWAKRQHLPLQVQYTIPVEPTGLEANALAVLSDAAATGTRIDVVNIMTFDYYLASEPGPLNMAAEAISAARNVHAQLAGLYSRVSQARLWAMEGITLMPGIDDYPGKTEITTVGDTGQVLGFARHQGLGLMSMWAIQRDNGGCPGTIGAGTCSGVTQSTWAFSHLLERFTG
ncbi:MAG TPA: chitinase [Streptosporangiaceae bacterium]